MNLAGPEGKDFEPSARTSGSTLELLKIRVPARHSIRCIEPFSDIPYRESGSAPQFKSDTGARRVAGRTVLEPTVYILAALILICFYDAQLLGRPMFQTTPEGWFIFVAGGGFLVAIIAGKMNRKRSGLWAAVDRIYYPIMIVGLMFAYFEAAPLREYVVISRDLDDLTAKQSAILAAQPDVREADEYLGVARASGSLLATVVEMADACSGLQRIEDPNCAMATELAPIVRPHIRTLESIESQSDLEQVCQAAETVFTEFDAKRIFILQPLLEYFGNGLHKSFGPTQFDEVRRYIEGARPILRERASMVIGVADEAMRRRLSSRYDALIDLGLVVALSFESCLRAPQTIRDGTMREWTRRAEAMQDAVSATQTELARANEQLAGPNDIGVWRVTFWPYIILFALLLKVAKAYADLRWQCGAVRSARAFFIEARRKKGS